MFGGPSLLLLPISDTVTFFDSSWAGCVFSHTKRYYSHDFCVGLENLRFCENCTFPAEPSFPNVSGRQVLGVEKVDMSHLSSMEQNRTCFTDVVLPSFFADIQTSLHVVNFVLRWR